MNTTYSNTGAPLRRRSVRKQGDDMVALRDILDTCLQNWKWFVFSAIVCLALSRVYLATKNNVYQRQAVMLVKDDATSGSRKPGIGMDALMQLNGVMGGTSVKNEVYILQSFQLMQEVVRKLGLDVEYSVKSGLRRVSLYDNKPITVNFLEEFTVPAVFKVEILNGEECVISEVRCGIPMEDTDYTCKAKFGEKVSTPFGSLIVSPVPELMENFEGGKITVTRLSLEDATIITLNKITSSEIDKESTLVQVTCKDTSIKRADDILAAILEAYKQSIIADKNQVAQSTSEFIEERIKLIHSELSSVESELADFKQSSGLVDLKAISSAYLQQSSTARQTTIQAETQYSMVQYLVDYLTDSSKGKSLIPTMGGISDPGIQQQISQYNQLMLTRNRLAENTGENSPALKEMDSNLYQMQATVLASLQGFAASLKLQVDKARAEEAGLQGNITAVPQKEKKVMEIARQQSIKETLYTYLLNKREETALQLAITEANIRVVERPFGATSPIAPGKTKIMLVALILGLAIPFVFFQLKAMLNMGVRGRKDIEQNTTIPILGEIPHRKDGINDSEIIVAEQKDDVLGEAFRMLRFSLNFVQKDAHVIMFTSTMPGEGKTFISRNFAATLGLSGQKVLLVDTDIRKRTQSRLSARGNKDGLTSYLSGSNTDLRSMIVTENKECNLDFLAAGVTPPNPAELLMSERLEECIAELRTMYDYIVIDNVPAQVVADASIVNRVADITIYVVREGKVDRRYLPELERLYQENKFKHLTIVLNDCNMERKRYGYGYKYQSYSAKKKCSSILPRFRK